MKITLLLAALLLSVNMQAQKIGMKSNMNDVPGSFTTFPSCPARTSAFPSGTRNASPAKAPAGEKQTYYLEYYDAVYGFDEPCIRSHVQADIIFADGGMVYIPNMFFASQLPAYVEGKLDGNTITIDGGQPVGTVDNNTYYFANVNPNTGEVSDEPIVLTKDPQSGIWTTDSKTLIGLYINDMVPSNLYTFCTQLNYLPESMFPAPVSCKLTAKDYYDRDVTRNLEVIKTEDGLYIKNIMKGYENSWIVGLYGQDGSIEIPSYQVLGDDVAGVFIDDYSYNQPKGVFAYDTADGTYMLQDGLALTDMYSNGQDYSCYNMYFGMKISGLSAGISDIESDSQAVSTEYFDMSGRRISGAGKGVSIKVTKYADGTSKSVKVMR